MKIYYAIIGIFNKIKRDKIFVYASHASFYMLISSIPFITLFISLIKLFLALPESEISNAILPFFPKASVDTAEIILKEIFYNSYDGFLSFSVFSLLWTASRGISAIRRGLRNIYGTSNPPFLTDIITSVGLMFFMIILVVLILILATLSVMVNSPLLIGFFTLTTIFSLVYFLFSGRKLPLKSNLPGGISASFSWIIFIRVFSFYIEHFANYSYIYGSLTTIFILVLWLYFSTIIFFLGAELNIILFKKRQKKELL